MIQTFSYIDHDIVTTITFQCDGVLSSLFFKIFPGFSYGIFFFLLMFNEVWLRRERLGTRKNEKTIRSQLGSKEDNEREEKRAKKNK